MSKWIVLLVSISCIICCGNGLRKVFFKHYEGEKIKTYRMKIPSGYTLRLKQSAGEEGKEKVFVYIDSSKIYMSDFMYNFVNYENMKSDSSLFLKDALSLNGTDTISIYGVDSEGKHWKNVRYGRQISIGYLNVQKSNLDKFERTLKTFTSR